MIGIDPRASRRWRNDSDKRSGHRRGDLCSRQHRTAEAAKVLDASVGDVVQFGPEDGQRELTVVGIAEDTFLSGYRRGRDDFWSTRAWL